MFKLAFKALRSTSAARLFNLEQLSSFPKDLLITADFMRTVEISLGLLRATFVLDLY